jgi:hypothetical protein
MVILNEQRGNERLLLHEQVDFTVISAQEEIE